jgi:hypothetical protein
MNFNREGTPIDRLRIGKRFLDLKFEDLKIGEKYLTTILGGSEDEEEFEERVYILDKNEDTILVCRLFQLADVKILAKYNKVKLTLDFITETSIENSDLDEMLYVYDHVGDHIETVMGFTVKFNYL